MNFRFADPWILLLIPVVLYLWYRFSRKGSKLKFSHVNLFKRVKRGNSGAQKLRILKLLRIIAIILLIIALARPQGGVTYREVTRYGVDIILAVDISTSMLAEDLAPHKSRFDVAREISLDFIKKRRNDRIGLVVFAGEAYTQCPLTLDYNILKKFFDYIKVGMIKDGTAIGDALAVAIARLDKSKAKSKVVILLTDGMNNAGNVDSLTAARLAKTLGIKVYTIGTGTEGYALYPYVDPFFGTKRYIRQPVEIDEELLKKIAELTGGEYFRAHNKEELANIYDYINKMEKSKIKSKEYTLYTEYYHYFLFTAIGLLIIEMFLSSILWIKIP